MQPSAPRVLPFLQMLAGCGSTSVSALGRVGGWKLGIGTMLLKVVLNGDLLPLGSFGCEAAAVESCIPGTCLDKKAGDLPLLGVPDHGILGDVIEEGSFSLMLPQQFRKVSPTYLASPGRNNWELAYHRRQLSDFYSISPASQTR